VGSPLIVVSVAGLAVAGVGYLGGRLLFRNGVRQTHARVAVARAAVKTASANGASPADIAESLIVQHKLPPLPAIRVLSDATALPSADAYEVLRPYLTNRQQDTLDGMPTARFTEMLGRFD
jgi:hypothetical protein